MFFKTIIVFATIMAMTFAGVVPVAPAAYLANYASSYNAHTVNHAFAAPVAAAPLAAAPIAAAPYLAAPAAYSAYPHAAPAAYAAYPHAAPAAYAAYPHSAYSTYPYSAPLVL